MMDTMMILNREMKGNDHFDHDPTMQEYVHKVDQRPGSWFQKASSALEQRFRSPSRWNDDDCVGWRWKTNISHDEVSRWRRWFTSTNPHSKTPETEKAIRNRKKMNWKENSHFAKKRKLKYCTETKKRKFTFFKENELKEKFKFGKERETYICQRNQNKN